jgi:heat shock protein HslJ
MKSVVWGLVALMILAVVCAGCTSQKTSAPATSIATPAPVVTATTPAVPALPANLAGSWQLTTMAIQDGTAVTHPTTAITLYFNSDGTVTGNGGCNNYNGPYSLTGTTNTKGSGITIGPLASTKMYCQATSSQESTYLNILGKTMAYDVDTTQLTLTASDQNVLIYQRPSTIPTVTEGMLPA